MSVMGYARGKGFEEWSMDFEATEHGYFIKHAQYQGTIRTHLILNIRIYIVIDLVTELVPL